ncbi:drebrin-like protein isoform X2 [Zophobas morio]|uniref:drebrin-like protein isoform X2 n=1 Tax=Zophobas morio TaxID=2755281 RepID=UPI003082BC96
MCSLNYQGENARRGGGENTDLKKFTVFSNISKLEMCDLATHGSEIMTVCNEIYDESSPTNWLVLGYVKNSDTIEVRDFGEDGLDGFIPSLAEDTLVLYGFVKVKVDQVDQPKYIYIIYIGEAAPIARKAIAAQHSVAIEKLFKVSHLTFHARCEQDIEKASVLKRLEDHVKKFSNSRKVASVHPPSSPVGTLYKKPQIIPGKTSSLKEKFERQPSPTSYKRREEEKVQELLKESAAYPSRVPEVFEQPSRQDPDDQVRHSEEGYVEQSASPVSCTKENKYTATVLYDYQAADEEELTLVPGAILYGITALDENWWYGYDETGRAGARFPAEYVQLYES